MPRRIPSFRPRGTPTPKQHAAEYDATAARKADHAFYAGAPWLKTRAYKLMVSPLCEDCLKRGVTTAATAVHHVIERKLRPDLALDPDNLESVCAACHNAKRRKR